MKCVINICVCLLLVLLNQGCANEVDIAGPYEEGASVYALLDPSQEVQYIKINKTFTNPNGSAASAAQQIDSLYFDSLTPTLLEIETGRIIQLYKTNTITKAPGLFANSVNYLYTTKEKLYAHNPNNIYQDYHYRLDLDLPAKKKHISAVTNVPDSTILLGPSGIVNPINKVMEFTSGSLKFGFQAPVNSKVFDGYFYFYFLEMQKRDTSIREVKSIRIRMFSNLRTLVENSIENLSSSIDGNFFYESLLAKIKIDTNVIRRAMPCHFELGCGNQEFDNYMQTSEPSIGIVQKQTDYSNVLHGVGLFASRRISRYNNISLGAYTRKRLTKDSALRTLQFVN